MVMATGTARERWKGTVVICSTCCEATCSVERDAGTLHRLQGIDTEDE